ncbi:hypothetical protein CLG_B0845 [Clostridium botulinum D str. 1873]|uniref:Uncharacterized protein n=1 Tax=Clostridium botulinum D str. 1873 TaxID=592027 RepID=A0A9P2G861_CLOBO|nr:hypothetical protein CLG_B0845 [Clostridium botulinum D str. 1873]
MLDQINPLLLPPILTLSKVKSMYKIYYIIRFKTTIAIVI